MKLWAGTNNLKYPNILCSYALYEYVKQKYPKRRVHKDAYCPQNQFFYWTRTGKLRMVLHKTELYGWFENAVCRKLRGK